MKKLELQKNLIGRINLKEGQNQRIKSQDLGLIDQDQTHHKGVLKEGISIGIGIDIDTAIGQKVDQDLQERDQGVHLVEEEDIKDTININLLGEDD